MDSPVQFLDGDDKTETTHGTIQWLER